jgi:hypothetical membrane protein
VCDALINLCCACLTLTIVPQFASSYVFVKRYLSDAGTRVQHFSYNLSQLLLDTVPALVKPAQPACCPPLQS